MTEEKHECRHCSEEFHGERSLLKHLNSEHYEQLGPVDKRRVDEQLNQPNDFATLLAENIGMVAIAAVLGLGGAALYFSLGINGSGGVVLPDGVTPPDENADVHAHGTVSIVTDGSSVDLTQEKYQGRTHCFHFHPGQSDAGYHMHCGNITPAYASAALGLQLESDGEVAKFNEETYRTAEGDTVALQVNGESVDPYTYQVQEGDNITIELDSAEN